MKKASAVVAVFSVLVLGVVAGVLGTHLFYAQKLRQAGSLSGMASDFVANRLERELELSPEQRQAIEEIMAESQVEGRALREEMRPRVTEMMQRTTERIEEVLTPEQRERFAEFRERHRGRAERFLLGPPGGPGRRGGPGWREGGPGGPGRRGERRGEPPWREGPPPGPPAEPRPEPENSGDE